MCHHCLNSCDGFSRREMLASAAGTAIIGGLLARQVQAAGAAASRPATNREMPEVRAVFIRPKQDYWLGWPGTAWDKNMCGPFMNKCRQLVGQFAADMKIRLTWADEPLHDDAATDKFVAAAKADNLDGTIVFPLHFQNWPQVAKIADSGIPTIIFAPLGVCFTGHIQKIAKQAGVYLASCADFDLNPVRFGLRMVRAHHDIRRTRIAVLAGTQNKEQVLEPLGLSLKFLPRERFVEALATVQVTPEVRAIADDYKKAAARIVEPTDEDLLNAARNYVAARKILQEEDCQGITMDCLGLVAERKIPTPPCMAWCKFLDEGISATCEADIRPVMSQELCLKLLGKPGFVQDPVPNTVDNTFIGAHCVCGTRIFGFDKDPAKFILRSHAESDLGVSFQVIWPEGTDVTVMELMEPGRMILGQGKVIRNYETPPAGGCRTSVELELDGPADVRDTQGFHQLFITGKHVRDFQAYAQMYGIVAEHI
ncbi:MAG TPA: hypothetical protein PLL20_20895 [Phycisphaerae bacterium]|nr:hypothetical protein [Phycisphaerae bacterium]HRR87133.1 hypothetical protein [Phycisphaerae bacterium]